VKKLLAMLCAFALVCGLGLTTTGCGKKEGGKTTTEKASTVTTAPATTK
jgi:hypothetical protein